MARVIARPGVTIHTVHCSHPCRGDSQVRPLFIYRNYAALGYSSIPSHANKSATHDGCLTSLRTVESQGKDHPDEAITLPSHDSLSDAASPLFQVSGRRFPAEASDRAVVKVDTDQVLVSLDAVNRERVKVYCVLCVLAVVSLPRLEPATGYSRSGFYLELAQVQC